MMQSKGTIADTKSEKRSLKEKRLAALDHFLNLIKKQNQDSKIVKIILFGSLIKNKLTDDSDIDLLVITAGETDSVSEICADAALWTGIETGISVEPLVYCIDQLRYPHSVFIYKVWKRGFFHG